MNINLYNTLTKKKEKFIPINSSSVKMYACGPTLYSNPHIGNFRPIIIFDILFRVLRLTFGEDKVCYVRNITDIDDKIIDKANELVCFIYNFIIYISDISDITYFIFSKSKS